MKIHDKEFEEFISSYDIENKVEEMATSINREFEFGPPPVFIGVLDGSFRVIADLTYHVGIEAEWSFIKVSSYEGTESTGKIKELVGLNTDIKGKVVIIVEDIIDTGLTIDFVIQELRKHDPDEIRIMTLLIKPDAYKGKYEIDYIGFSITNDFVVGYGLDYDGYGRGANDIYKLKK